LPDFSRIMEGIVRKHSPLRNPELYGPPFLITALNSARRSGRSKIIRTG
jgi:hypothetical protein